MVGLGTRLDGADDGAATSVTEVARPRGNEKFPAKGGEGGAAVDLFRCHLVGRQSSAAVSTEGPQT